MLKQQYLCGLSAAFLCTIITTTGVSAQELNLYGGAALEYYTKNDDGPSKTDLNGYLELDYNGLYGGIWAELTDWDDYNEVDLYFGYRGESGQLSYDISYYYYVYPDVDDADYGEIVLALGYNATDTFGIGFEVYHDPESGNGSAYINPWITVGDKLTFDTYWGKYDEGFGSFSEWELGVKYALTDEVSLGLRYYDGEEYDDYIRLQLAWDTTLFTR